MSTTYPISKDEYLQFDATTIDQYIKDRLNTDPNTKFTDHNFEGSYFSSLIEVVSYTFNVLMFYLNQTSTESKFTDVQIYENMNRIVKMLGYNPLGPQTAIVPFTATSNIDDNGLYVIPRYSYINAGGTTYSFNEDFVFRGGSIEEAISGKILYQGKFYEYPIYTGLGVKNEIVFLTPGDNILVDHFNIYVYVKSNLGIWEQWERVESLTAKEATDTCYEVRYNENYRYEIKFGNGVNGALLPVDAEVQIYYLQSNGPGYEISKDSISNSTKYIKYASQKFTAIMADLWKTNPKTIVDPSVIFFSNGVPSTLFSEAESVESIRNSAPETLKRKLTISKTGDYERVVKTVFDNLISDVVAFNNTDYIKQYLNYFRELGLDGANSVSRIMYNQTIFADSCNFNNIYVFIKPKIYSTTSSDYNRFLPASLKQLILNEFKSLKQPTVEPIIMDPVYMALGFGISDLNLDISVDDVANSELVIIKDNKSLRNNDVIAQDVVDIITEYFSQANTTFAMTIDFAKLSELILSVGGVVDMKIRRKLGGYEYAGLSFISWNPIYPQDISKIIRTETFEPFQVPYLINRSELIKQVVVENSK